MKGEELGKELRSVIEKCKRKEKLSDDDYYVIGLVILALYIKSPLSWEALKALVFYLDKVFGRDRKDAIIEIAKELLEEMDWSEMVHITTK